MNNIDASNASILVVEDEWLLADELEQTLVQQEFDVVGPAPNVREALHLIDTNRIDAAILDVNLGRENSFPIATALVSRSIPFLFVTGYLSTDLPREFTSYSILSKPLAGPVVVHQLRHLLAHHELMPLNKREGAGSPIA